MTKSVSFLLVLVIAAAVGVVGVVAARAQGGRREQLKIAAVRQPATSLLFVAQANRCFEAERLELAERSHELGRDALVELLEGRADVAVAYETPILKRYANDQRLRVLSVLHSSTRNTRVVARRDRGITALTDLRGRRVSAAMGTNAEFFVQHLLTFAGLAPSDVTIVDLEPDVAINALASGEVDAAVLSDPHAERARRAIAAQATEIVSDLYAEYSMVVTRVDVVAARREALVALLRGLACGERALREEPAASFAAVRKRFPERTDSELQVALERVNRSIGLDEALWASLVREARWMYSAAADTDPPPDLRPLIEPTLLEAVEPSAVNLLTRR